MEIFALYPILIDDDRGSTETLLSVDGDPVVSHRIFPAPGPHSLVGAS